MKFVTIIGARPQFIKASALSRELKKRHGCEEVLVHTGQHFDANMSAIFFEEMEIPEPKYNLAINSLSHGAMTGRMLEEIENILLIEKPDWVVVYGDTNSTLAGALAAKKLHIKVAHIEAGLRSFDRRMPEEINRILTDQLSDILFCPTKIAIDNLEKEGFADREVQMVPTGDIMYDSALHYKAKMKRPESIGSIKAFVLVTVHRQENTDEPKKLKNIVDALNAISNEGNHIIWPIHPRTRKIIEKHGWDQSFKCIDPVGYLEMLYLLHHCSSVMTDSGGLQKEAYFFGKYCLTLRNSTEWIELIEHGVNTLIDVDSSTLVQDIQEHLEKKADSSTQLYGKGNAAVLIADALMAEPS